MFDLQTPTPGPSAATIDFPEKLQCLFRPSRFKVLHGGRGGAKSWGIARALLLIGRERTIRVLCVRELQKSMEDSVHKLLVDQIEAMGMSGEWQVMQKGLLCYATGTTFSFEGIKNNAQKVKSYEGIDYCWLEEGAKVSKASFEVLTPTIRKPGSEIWVSMNPELETDYLYDRFIRNAEDRAIVQRITWRDNPWFPEELRLDMEADFKRDEDSALHVWEGHTKKNLEGAIYAKELRAAELAGRITKVPWDREHPVNTYWDLGRGDSTCIWFIQRVGFEWRVLNYYAESGEDFTHFMLVLQEKAYVYGDHYLPHDGKAKQLGTKKTIQEQLAAKYPRRVHIVPRQNLVDGIQATRTVMANCWWDEKLCVDGLNALRNYRYRIIDGQRSNIPLHDWASDGADAFRTFATSQRAPKASAEGMKSRMKAAMEKFRATAPAGPQAWMG